MVGSLHQLPKILSLEREKVYLCQVCFVDPALSVYSVCLAYFKIEIA